MKLAAIDIGSNAIRFQLTKVINYNEEITFKKLEYIRFPLRLGHDTFSQKRILPASEQKFLKILKAFKLLIELYEVDGYMACATSAMREAENGFEIAKRVKDEVGIEIQIIDGEREAEIIGNSLKSFIQDDNYLHIDVGGGSTELNFYSKRKKINSKSFKLGSVRTLESSYSQPSWDEMREWINEQLKKLKGEIIAIGTGGNINKLYDLTKTKSKRILSFAQLVNIQKHIKQYSYEERINILKLNDDRADVIIPASEIYLSAMKWVDAKIMIIPDIGLKDGMIQFLYETKMGPSTKRGDENIQWIQQTS